MFTKIIRIEAFDIHNKVCFQVGYEHYSIIAHSCKEFKKYIKRMTKCDRVVLCNEWGDYMYELEFNDSLVDKD